MGLEKKQPNQRARGKRGAAQSNKRFVWARYLFFFVSPPSFLIVN